MTGMYNPERITGITIFIQLPATNRDWESRGKKTKSIEFTYLKSYPFGDFESINHTIRVHNFRLADQIRGFSRLENICSVFSCTVCATSKVHAVRDESGTYNLRGNVCRMREKKKISGSKWGYCVNRHTVLTKVYTLLGCIFGLMFVQRLKVNLSTKITECLPFNFTGRLISVDFQPASGVRTRWSTQHFTLLSLDQQIFIHCAHWIFFYSIRRRFWSALCEAQPNRRVESVLILRRALGWKKTRPVTRVWRKAINLPNQIDIAW